jgi:tRNA(Ile2) C34 agmatinyltransferase TiaS
MRSQKVVCEVCNRRLGAVEEWALGSKGGRFRCMRCATASPAAETETRLEHASMNYGWNGTLQPR